MQAPAQAREIVRFGPFEVDLQALELRKSGRKIDLQRQPFQILMLLLEKRGGVLSRDELRRRLWPDGTFVDFEHSVNAAVKRLRTALGDDAVDPRFIETVHGLGYRFIGPLDGGLDGANTLATRSDSMRNRYWRFVLGFAVLTICISAAAARLLMGVNSLPSLTATVQRTFSGRVLESQIATDGSRIYFTTGKDWVFNWGFVSVTGGEQASVPTRGFCSRLQQLSPDGSLVLINESGTGSGRRADEGYFWLFPSIGGGARRLGDVIGHNGVWSRDGQHILYAAQQDLSIVDLDGSNSRKLVTTPGRAGWIRLSPDGSRLRFNVADPKTAKKTIWECRADGSDLHPLRLSLHDGTEECCGEWTSDGQYFFFLVGGHGRRDVWVRRERGFLRHGAVSRLTSGPLDISAAVPSPDGNHLFVVGQQTSAELFRYSLKSRTFTRELAGISTGEAAVSRDGKWISYSEVRGREYKLWLSRPDGTGRLQLTTPPLIAEWQTWSPDSKQFAFWAKMPDGPWKIYLVPILGSEPQALALGERNVVDPEWSPDGHSLMFGHAPDNFEVEGLERKAIYVINLDTKQLSTLPGSDGLFSPRWSPDGRYVLAMPRDYHKLMLFNFASQTWTELASDSPEREFMFDNPRWFPDSKSLYVDEFPGDSVVRIERIGGKPKEILDLKTVDPNASYCRLHNITWDEDLLIGCWFEGGDIYSLDIKLP
jgi:Tol biopolymer transport system component/DNA-binding winged helix-turn-helix (wHTH) protein